MSKNISKLGMGRVCLIFIIILWGVFTSENVLSRKHWDTDDMKVTYFQKKRIITFDLLFYDYLRTRDEHAYLENCTISYSEDGNIYTSLMKASTKDQKGKSEVNIHLWYKKYIEKIHVTDINITDIFFKEWLDLQSLNINGNVKKGQYKDGKNILTSERCYLRFYWILSQSIGRIKSIKINGFWKINDASGGDKFIGVYRMGKVKLNSNTLKTTPSELNSEMNDKVKITRQADAIVVAGVEPGEDIKVYTATGEELKSVVAHDDVVNIKLPKNQIYIVNTGKARYKVAL